MAEVRMMKRIVCVAPGGMAAPVMILDVPDDALIDLVSQGEEAVLFWFQGVGELATKTMSDAGYDIRTCEWEVFEIEDPEAN